MAPDRTRPGFADRVVAPPRTGLETRELSMSTTETIAPHGSTLVDLVLPKDRAGSATEEAEHLPKRLVKRDLTAAGQRAR